MRNRALAKAARNILIVGIPLIVLAAIAITIYNTNPTKYLSIFQSLTHQFPAQAEQDLINRLRSFDGAANQYYTVTSAQHASTPQRHWNPLVNQAVDMWCVVISPPSAIQVMDAGNRPLRSFLVYQTHDGGRWQITDGIAVFHADQRDFNDVSCTNYQH